MRYVVAVSGGVDSVVLLDMLMKRQLPYEGDFIVAHFDHGIRPDSSADATFVGELAAAYNVPFETKREELGVSASEELARERRYAFLRNVACRYNATLLTAHHADDVGETIAINARRGTGWRGVAVLDSPGIERPLVAFQKKELYEYAHAHTLQWHEDSTNQNNKYLRNQLRNQLKNAKPEDVLLLGRYRKRQVVLKRLIDHETQKLIGSSPYSRYFFTMLSEREAIELLRAVFVQETGSSPTIPQRHRALLAIKTYAPGSRYEVAKGVTITFSLSTFVVGE